MTRRIATIIRGSRNFMLFHHRRRGGGGTAVATGGGGVVGAAYGIFAGTDASVFRALRPASGKGSGASV
jgi:hypothetical protein